jgi:hypothetical protein
MGRLEDARRIVAEASLVNPRWPTFLERVAASGAQPELADPIRRLLGG